jgi:hypothetical protein
LVAWVFFGYNRSQKLQITLKRKAAADEKAQPAAHSGG